jgi:hypothetical protein
VALAAALLPLVTVHLTYVVAAWLGHVPWCVPHLHSCSSISATGRLAPEYHLFKALMIPAALLLACYWWLGALWLRRLGASHGRRRALLSLGFCAAFGLLLYSVMLGSIGPQYQMQRRIGITLFFGFGYLAQLLLTELAWHAPGLRLGAPRLLRGMWLLLLAIMLLGLGSVAVDAWDAGLFDRIVDALEWQLAVLLCLHVAITAALWRRSDFAVHFTVEQR